MTTPRRRAQTPRDAVPRRHPTPGTAVLTAEGHVLEHARIYLGLTQTEAAGRAGISRQRWQVVITGRRGTVASRPHDDTILMCALAVRVRPEEIEHVRPQVAAELRRQLVINPRPPDPSLSREQLAAELMQFADVHGSALLQQFLTPIVAPFGLSVIPNRRVVALLR